MAKSVADRVKETTTSTGTGNITLAGAVSQFVAFSSKFATGESFYYSIVGQSGTEWEVGQGHLSASTTLVRDTVLSSSNADAAVNFSAGTKYVFCTIAAAGVGASIAKRYTQTAHGFAVGDAVYLTSTAGTWAKAKADAIATLAHGIVSSVPSANVFEVTVNGYVDGLTGLTAGAKYYVSAATAGALTTAEPTTFSQPILIADSTTSGFVMLQRAATRYYQARQPTYVLTGQSGDVDRCDPMHTAVIPATPYQITLPDNCAQVSGVFDSSGVQFYSVASAPATGQYSVSGNVVTFAAADTGLTVLIRYCRQVSTVYYTPFGGRVIDLYDGAGSWQEYNPAELSIAVPSSADTAYDVYVYLSGGVPALNLVAWPDTVTPPSRTTVDGVLLNTADTTKRYVGAILTRAAGFTEDSKEFSYISNHYNKMRKIMWRSEDSTTSSHAYTTAAARQFNANTRNQLNMFFGTEQAFTARSFLTFSNTGANVECWNYFGINSVGLDVIYSQGNRTRNPAAGALTKMQAEFSGSLGLGKIYLTMLEYSTASGTTNWYHRMQHNCIAAEVMQ